MKRRTILSKSIVLSEYEESGIALTADDQILMIDSKSLVSGLPDGKVKTHHRL
jgi:hypothetical protein